MPSSMKILGLETSCDETAAAIYDGSLRAHVLHSQAAMHAEYGGVVPELAARDHVGRIQSLVSQVLDQAGMRARDLDGIAYTAGPGLIGALLVGGAFAAGLAKSLGIPLLGVHHLEGHLLAPMLEAEPPQFPFVALLVSGGHTLLARVDGVGCYEILGETLGRCCRRSLRQDRQGAGPAIPRRPGAGQAGGARRDWALQVSAADDRSSRPGFQLQRTQDGGPAGAAESGR